jgi:hypothetical protein
VALKAVLASLEGIAESLQVEYKKGDDGRFYLDVDGIEDTPAVEGLRNKYRTVLDEKKQVQKKLDEIGVTPEEVADLREKAKVGGKGANAEAVAALEAKLADVQKAAQAEIDKAKQEATREKEANRKSVKDAEVATAIAKAGANPKLAKLIEDQFDVRLAEDGRYNVVVMKDGQPRTKGLTAEPFTADDLMTELKQSEDWGIFFPASGKTGSGAAAATAGATTGGNKQWSDMTLTEKSQAYLADPTIKSRVDSGELKVTNVA